MRTNIEIDDQIIAEVMTRSGRSTKREAVDFTMRRYLQIERQKEAVEGLRGLGWDGDLEAMRTAEPPVAWG
ncbi:type II toxin-antitoxin system VapB family antitoxin [Sphingomonas sp.]|uniref:type II toxin-antitoxin system VapB family antitoxin n=1 Tax=Sphingomonas sp. TaxID=28214 RepID=UPI003B005254